MTRILTGALNATNKGAIDWGYQGLLAYGCQNMVVVLHTGSVKCIQTLAAHNANVTKVRWCPENYPHGPKVPAHMRLASVDEKGNIIVWDLNYGSEHCSFSEQNTKVIDIAWSPWQDTSKDFLFALHPPYNLILWNADTGEKIWKKSYTESLLSFSLDPFCCENMAFVTNYGNLMLVSDLCVSKVPSGNGQVFRISSQNPEPDAGPDRARGQALLSSSARFIVKPFQALKVPKKISDDLISQLSDDSSNVLQMTHHPAVRDLLLMVYSREVLFLDKHTLQTTAHVLLDKNMASFSQVHPCWHRDAVYFVQDNGCVTLRLQKCRNTDTQKKEFSVDVENSWEVIYEGVCMSESLRITKAYRVLASAICPTNETYCALLMITGKMLLYNLASSTANPPVPSLTLSDLVTQHPDLSQSTVSKLRLVLYGLWTGVGQQPTVVRARPPLTDAQELMEEYDRQPLDGRALVAVATGDGYVQLIDTDSGEILKDFSVHNCPIRCLEWGGPNHLVTAGYTQTLSTSSVVRNDVLWTDVRTALVKPIRPECDESPVEMIRVSYYHCYLAIAFRDNPMEIWDLKHFRLLRRMSRSCPVIIDMAWSGKHHQARSVPKTAAEDYAPLITQTKTRQTIYRENLVVLDNENHLYHVVVKGLHVRDGKEVNTQWATTSQVNAMVWKDDYLAFGDNEGKLSVWDLALKQSKASPLQRGAVIRLQFSRIPGDHRLAVLHSDGIAVWDAAKFTPMHQIVTPRDLSSKVIDLDLCLHNSRVAILTNDGCVRLALHGMRFEECLPPDYMDKGIFCPQLLSPSTVSLFVTLLCEPYFAKLSKESTGADGYINKLVEEIQKCTFDEDEKERLIMQINSLDEDILEIIYSTEGVAQRAKMCAVLLGNEWDVILWSTICCSLEGKDKTLEPSLDYLWTNEMFRTNQLRRCCLFDSRRASTEQLRCQIESLIHLGQFVSAVQLLLNVEPTDPEHYAHALKACLLSANHSSPECQSTVKLIATNLIATGKINEGVELLCLIGKSSDACRYLQSHSYWLKGAFLAKATLDEENSSHVLGKWADYLGSPNVGQKTESLLISASLSQWPKVLEQLLSQRQVNSAALLLNCIDEQECGTVSSAIYAEYARELQSLGLIDAALEYCKFGGELGRNIEQEIKILSSD